MKYINNKEDGSISSFVKLPNGKILGKSKMSFESDQAIGMNRIYNKNKDVKSFVDWTLDNDIIAIFEYVSPTNKIVLNYTKEDMDRYIWHAYFDLREVCGDINAESDKKNFYKTNCMDGRPRLITDLNKKNSYDDGIF